MNEELLSILEHLEREKGIKKEILIEAVEQAVVSAARKELGPEVQEVEVKLDPKTGEIEVFSDGKRVTSGDFGRIAAQAAKQVIIQKIREAERDVIYEDFHKRVDTLTNGLVYRFEKGNLIVDLGKTEAILPKSEQSPKEVYRQGERIRVYILEVKKTPRGPHIVLSRTNAGLVKHLFELEVPEIYEGIVQIKAVAREAGERTKIAVYSTDEKIDCVGACVGMRGSRVKNIVRELRGEKIDIIRWNENPREFIAGALSPAEVSSMEIDEAKKAARVLVADDQLSLAIGKHGQNVRLASKLSGWSIDIRSAEKPEGKKGKAKKPELARLSGVGEKTRSSLSEAGFKTFAQIAAAEVSDLTKIKGVGKKKAENLIAQAKKLKGIKIKKKQTKAKDSKAQEGKDKQ